MTGQPSIVEAITSIKRDVGHVAKTDRNRQQNYEFRGVDAVVNAIAHALISHGVVVAPQLREYHYTTVEVGDKRTPMGHARVTVAYTFHGPAGDNIVAVAPGEAFDRGDKATPKAMSVAYRTALLQTLTLPTQDTDPDADSYERSQPAPAAASPPAPMDLSPIAQTIMTRVEDAASVEQIREEWATMREAAKTGDITPGEQVVIARRAERLVEEMNRMAPA